MQGIQIAEVASMQTEQDAVGKQRSQMVGHFLYSNSNMTPSKGFRHERDSNAFSVICLFALLLI